MLLIYSKRKQRIASWVLGHRVKLIRWTAMLMCLVCCLQPTLTCSNAVVASLAKTVIVIEKEIGKSCIIQGCTESRCRSCRSRCRHGDEDMQRTGSRYLNDEGAQLDSSHDVTPGCIHLPEGAAFLGDLLHDLLRAEDGLQVQPLALPHAAKDSASYSFC